MFEYEMASLSPKTTVSVRLDAETIDKLEKYARSNRVRRSDALVHYIKLGIESEEARGEKHGSGENQLNLMEKKLDALIDTVTRLESQIAPTRPVPDKNSSEKPMPRSPKGENGEGSSLPSASSTTEKKLEIAAGEKGKATSPTPAPKRKRKEKTSSTSSSKAEK